MTVTHVQFEVFFPKKWPKYKCFRAFYESWGPASRMAICGVKPKTGWKGIAFRIVREERRSA